MFIVIIGRGNNSNSNRKRPILVQRDRLEYYYYVQQFTVYTFSSFPKKINFHEEKFLMKIVLFIIQHIHIIHTIIHFHHLHTLKICCFRKKRDFPMEIFYAF